MDSAEDKLWASKYLLDPITAPQSHRKTDSRHYFSPTAKTAEDIPLIIYPTPTTSASPTCSTFHPTNPFSSYRQQAFSAYAEDVLGYGQSTDKSTAEGEIRGRRRGRSLGERFPGDTSHRPLEVLKREAKAANRSPHLTKRQIPGADLIDNLDRSSVGGAYHHEGPYDATLLARNTSSKISPVEAVKETNAEALRATPKEHIRDALDKHIPLYGTAVIPPGGYDYSGQKMNYEEGADLMREDDAEGGAYKRWSGMKYHPNDLKGKGEPSFLIERALKEHENKAKAHRRIVSDGDSDFGAAKARQRSPSGSNAGLAKATMIDSQTAKSQIGMGRSNSTGRRVGEGLKRRFGSLRRNKKHSTEV